MKLKVGLFFMMRSSNKVPSMLWYIKTKKLRQTVGSPFFAIQITRAIFSINILNVKYLKLVK